MSESFNFELKLVSDLDKVARRNVDSLKNVQVQGQKTQKALDWGGGLGKQFEKIGFAGARAQKKQQDGFAGMFGKIGFAAEKAAQKQHQSFANSWAKIGMAAQRAQVRAHAQAERLAEKSQQHSLLGGIKEGVGFEKLTSAAFIGSAMAEGAFRLVDALLEGAHKVVDVIEDGIAKAFESAGHEEKLGRQFKLSLGGKEGGESLEDAGRFSKLTKFTPEQIAPMLLRLRRAGFGEKSARQTIATGSDIEAAGGLSTQEYAEFAEHLKLKGGVTSKQLVGAGVNAPQFYKDLGKKLGIGADAAEKKAGEGGKIDSQLMLNMITEAVNKKQGGAAGTGGIAESTGFEARFAKFSALSEQYLKRLSNSPGLKSVSEMFGKLLDKLDPDSPTGKRIQAAIETMFGKITAFVGDPEDAAEGLASAVEQTVHLFGEAVDAARDLADALVPSLDTIQDMLIGLRQVVAIQSGDKAGLAAAAQQEVDVKAQRVIRMFDKQNRMRAKFEKQNQDAFDDANQYEPAAGGASGATAGQYAQNVAGANSMVGGNAIPGVGGKVTHIHVAPGAVVVHGAAGDESTRKEAGDGLHREVTKQLARAAQGGG